MAKRVFIIHGWEGSPTGGWKPWLKRNLEKNGYVVVVPLMPHSFFPQMSEWLEHMSKIIGTPNEDCFLVGHSLGCIAILRYLESLKEGEKIGGVILVAGFGTSLPLPPIQNFFKTPLDWKKVKSHCTKFVAIHSDNDAYVAMKHGTVFKEKLGAQLIVMHNKGHFSDDDKCFELPIVLEKVLEISGK